MSDSGTITAPHPWQHKHGYRLNADGRAITYTHPMGREAVIMAMDSDDGDGLEYRPAVFGEDSEMLEYSEVFHDKERAKERLEELMAKHD